MSSGELKTITAIPDASSMIESFRAVGYSMETAIADIIDNSISAKSKNVWIDYIWNGAKTILSIRDDGEGMSDEELVNAMRPGCKHPLTERHVGDLGRFGLGLKTASFSQTRKFSLISKRSEGEVVYWAWDLDHVSKSESWELIHYLPDEIFFSELEKQESGTTVIWYEIDRQLVNTKEDDKLALAKFMEVMESVSNHLSMVFHRYIEKGRLNIYFQQRLISYWDPFLKNEIGVQVMPDENLLNGKVTLKGYVLPHKSKLTEEVFRSASGSKGWNQHQGFYIYRNERLLVAGSWLGMFKQEEHYKLARIMIDIPNSLDNEWQIDIKKSVARPPASLIKQIKSYANSVRSKAVEVYRHRGKIVQRRLTVFGYVSVWLEKIKNGKISYVINKSHPIIKGFIDDIKSNKLNSLLRFIENNIPISLIAIRENENADLHLLSMDSKIDSDTIYQIRKVYKDLIDQGYSIEEAESKLLLIEPFGKFSEVIEAIKEEF